jgi:hypothetical protein
MSLSRLASAPVFGKAVFTLSVPLFASLALLAADPEYRSVSVDQSGQLHIVLNSKVEIQPLKAPGQVSFSDPAISTDRRTVGWLEEYPDPTITYYAGATLPFRLVIYRTGRVLHTFTTEQVFWDWQFQDGGKRIAYSIGPTHGGAAECVLRDVDSGDTVAHWWVKQGRQPPSWAQKLRQ